MTRYQALKKLKEPFRHCSSDDCIYRSFCLMNQKAEWVGDFYVVPAFFEVSPINGWVHNCCLKKTAAEMSTVEAATRTAIEATLRAGRHNLRQFDIKEDPNG